MLLQFSLPSICILIVQLRYLQTQGGTELVILILDDGVRVPRLRATRKFTDLHNQKSTQTKTRNKIKSMHGVHANQLKKQHIGLLEQE